MAPQRPTLRQTRPSGGGLDPKLQALYENLEILNGARGKGMDRAVLVRDLLDLGLATARKGVNGVFVPIKPGDGTGGEDGGLVEPPPVPRGVQASGGFSTILVEWDKPTYQGHAYTEILRSDTDDFSQASLVSTTTANLYSDQVGTSKIVYYWVRFVNRIDVKGPVQSTNGVRGETQADIGEILDKLKDQIDESFLTPKFESRLEEMENLGNLNKDKITDIDGEVLDVKEREEILSAEAEILAEAAMEAATGVDTEGTKRRKVTAEIKLVQKTLVTDTGAMASQILTIIAKQDDNTAAISETKTAVIKLDADTKTAIESVTQRIDSQESVINGNTASINNNSQTIVSLNGEISDAVKSIADLDSKTTSAIAAVSTRIDSQASEIGANKASITSNSQTLVVVGNKADTNTRNITSISDLVSTIRSEVNGNTASITSQSQTLVKHQGEIDSNKSGVDSANSSISTITTRLNTQESNIAGNTANIKTQGQTIVRVEGLSNAAQGTADTAKSDAAKAASAAASAAGIANSKGKVIIQSSAPASADRLAQNLWIDTTGGRNTPKRWSGSSWVAVTDKAAKDAAAAAAAAKAVADKAVADALKNAGKITVLSETLSTLESKVGSNTANITTQSQTIITVKNVADSAVSKADAAQGTANTANSKAGTAQNTANANKQSITVMSQQITTLTSSLNGVSATVSQNSQTIATINADGSTAYKAMWGVKASVGDITAGIGLTVKNGVSQCTIVADQFSVGRKGSNATIYPFIVTADGVFIDTAYIKAAKIQDLVAGEVVADNIKAGATLTAPYIKGGRIEIGSNFTVDANGNVTGSNVNFKSGTFKGTVNATAGVFNNVTINENCDVKGTIYADKIVGDVVSAITKPVTKRVQTSVGLSSAAVSGTVRYARSYSRTLVIGGIYLTLDGVSLGSDSRISARVKLNFTGVTSVYTNTIDLLTKGISGTNSEQIVIPIDNLAINVPANKTGTYSIQVEMTFRGRSGSTATLSSLAPVPVLLYRNGNGLS